MTQEELSTVSKVPKGTIGTIEAGNLKNAPTFLTLSMLETGLRLAPGSLVKIIFGDRGAQFTEGMAIDPDVAEIVQLIQSLPEELKEKYLRLAKDQLELLQLAEKAEPSQNS